MKEIERKWLVKDLPELSGRSYIVYERYILELDEKVETRIQKKSYFDKENNLDKVKFEWERKVEDSNLTRSNEKKEIEEEEFEKLKLNSTGELIRRGYQISENPNISIKIYDGKHIGLVRAEVEFESEEDAQSFQIPEWFGEEITNSDLGRDGKLVKLSEKEFKKLL